MRLAEKILALAVLIGVILQFSLVTIGEEITMISMLLLSSIYFLLGFLLFNHIRLRDAFKTQAYEHVAGGKIVIAVFVGLALSIVCIGILFKLLILPGAGEMLMIGGVSLLFLSIIVATLKSLDRKFILARTLVALIVGGALFFTSELSMVKLQYRNHPAYVDAYVRYKADPRNEALLDELQLEYYRIRMTEAEFKEYEKNEK